MFLQGTESVDKLFHGLGVPSRPRTQPASGARSPGTGEILVKRIVGNGSFGVVTHIWNVSNTDEYAIKEPTVRAIKNKCFELDAWKKEARIMGRVSHVSHPIHYTISILTFPQDHIAKLI